MNIREVALGDPHNLEAALAASIKAAESASAALEALTVSLMLAASFLTAPEPAQDDSGQCRHLEVVSVSTMGREAYVCGICYEEVPDAMHQ